MRPEYLRKRVEGLLEGDEFFSAFVAAKNKEIKKVLLDIHMKGEMLTTAERSSLASYIDYLVVTSPEYSGRAEAFSPQGIIKKLFRGKKK